MLQLLEDNEGPGNELSLAVVEGPQISQQETWGPAANWT